MDTDIKIPIVTADIMHISKKFLRWEIPQFNFAHSQMHCHRVITIIHFAGFRDYIAGKSAKLFSGARG